MAKFFACLAILLQLVSAIPQMSYPLNLQLPPVARAEAPYSFQFAPTTFSSSGRIQYSLIGNPFWLSLDGSSRTLSGTPHARDVGTVNFTVTAVEDGGVVVNMASQLLVSGDDGPTTKDDFSITLSAAGQISGSHAVTLKPSDTFDLSLPSDIFDSHGAALSYFALLSDRTPLPGWISFDATSMRFAGTVPPMDSTQSLQISLIASETPGFAAASVSFTMVISNHTLLFEPSAQTISATADDVVRITDLKEKLFLDDAHTDGDDIQSATADIPSWLSFDDKTFEIDGTVPPELESQDLSITAKSKFGDVANYTIHLVVRPKLFVGQIGTLILTSGRLFEHKLSRDDLATEVESVTADFGSLADYLHYDSATLTIRGTIPVDFPTEDVQCSLTATSGDGDNCVEDTQEFNISVSKAAVTSPTQAVGTVDSPRDGEDWKKIVTIIGAVLGGVFGILLLALFGFCLCRRKKQPKSQPNPRPSRKLRKHQITGPLSIRPEWLDMDENADDDMEKGKYTPDPFDARTPDRAHQLEFGSSNDRRDCHSVTESIGDADREILNEFEGSPFGFCSDTAPSQHPHSSMKIATDSGKRASQGSNAFRRHKRRATTVYQDQIHRSTGYPVHRRITGTGHDSYASSPPQSNANMSARGRPSSAASFLTTKTFSTSSSASPQSFNARKHTAFVTTPTEKRRSIRIVPASRRSSLTDERTIDEKRNSYFRNRASGSPFWGAGRRTSSSSYKSPPAFITAALSSPPAPLSHGNGNTGIRPDDDVMAGGEEIPAGLRIVQSPRELPETPKALRPLSESPKKEYPGSLRQNRINRPHTTLTPTRNRIEKSFARPSTTFSPSMSSLDRRSSTRHSLRAAELKASLNNLTGAKVFEDAELSDTFYSDEDRDIEEAENGDTIKPSPYTLPLPLKLASANTTKRGSKATDKKTKGGSQKELKSTSQHETTPYRFKFADEHGGKENAASTYTLGQRSSPVRRDPKGEVRPISSPSRPKARHSKEIVPEARKSHHPTSPPSRTSKAPSTSKERHSRKSIHSRTQSRRSGISATTPSKHSRTQSSAYPFFDAAQRPENRRSTPPPSHASPTFSLMTRDLSGNLTIWDTSHHDEDGYHDDDDDEEEATIEELRSSSIGFPTSKGRVNSPTAVHHHSRLASLHLATSSYSGHQPGSRQASWRLSSTPERAPTPPPKSEKRGTVLQSQGSLGLFPKESAGDLKRERGTASRLDSREGSVNVSVSGEGEKKKRNKWRWVSGGYWDKQGRDDKVFL